MPIQMAVGREGVGKGAAESAAAVEVQTAVWDSKLKQIVGGPLDGLAAETGAEAEALITTHYGSK